MQVAKGRADGRKGHVEIAGAGMAGLVAACAFAQRGWSVRLHDRYPSLRSEGFGISLFENGLRVLEAVRAYEGSVAEANPIRFYEHREDGVQAQRSPVTKQAFRISRSLITESLAAEARKAGAELIFDSPAVGADASGKLFTADGRTWEADLVIGADGVNSAVRGSIPDIVAVHRVFDEGAMRFIVERKPDDLSAEEAATAMEWWAGKRRVIFSPCSLTEHYLALSCREEDTLGTQTPIDVASWSEHFPDIAFSFERARDQVDWGLVKWVNFQEIRLKSWSRGRIALVGDAAHAMPPNLGQGGGTALMTALAMAVAVDEAPTIADGLRQWEEKERPLTEHTQSWSTGYLKVARLPGPLRSSVFWTVGKVKPLREQFFRTANHWPTGAVDRQRAQPLPLPPAFAASTS